MRPGKKPNTDRSIRVAFKKEENAALCDFIEEWQEEVYQRDYKDSYLQVVNVLPDEAISRLAQLKFPISSAAVRSILVEPWPHWDLHGEELLERLLSLPEGGPPHQLSTLGHLEDTNPSDFPTVTPTVTSPSPLNVQTRPAPPSTPTYPQTQPHLVPSSRPPQHTVSTHNVPIASVPIAVSPSPLTGSLQPWPRPPLTPAYPQAQRRLTQPSTPARLQGTLPSSGLTSAPVSVHDKSPHPAFHPPPFSPVIMYRHPVPQYHPGVTPFGGSFSYQDLANMANSSFQRWHHPASGQQDTTWPAATPSSHPWQTRPS